MFIWFLLLFLGKEGDFFTKKSQTMFMILNMFSEIKK